MTTADRQAGRGFVIRRVSLALCVAVAAVLIGSCDRTNSSTADSSRASETRGDLRIVSLTPAITQMLIDMGKRDQLVGVSREDPLASTLPVCGSFNDPIMSRILVEAKPDLVLTESPGGRLSGVPAMLRTRAADGVYRLGVIAHCESLDDIRQTLIDPDRGLAALVGDPAAAERALLRMDRQLDAVRRAVQDQPRPRVLMLLSPESLGAIGTGVTHDELLRLAGAVNAAAQYDTGYVTLSRSQVQVEARPDVVLILEPDGPQLASNDPRLVALRGIDVPAVSDQRIVLINHPQTLLPSTSLPEVLVQMATAIHPQRADAIERAYAQGSAEVDPVEQQAEVAR